MSERRFAIADGFFLLLTCYYVVLPRETIFAKTEEERQKHYDKILYLENNTYTNGILGVLKATASLLEEQAPDHIAFVSDKTRNTFHKKLYPGHKGTRSVTLEPLKQQFVLLEQILEGVGFRVLYDNQFKADDCTDSLVIKFKGQTPMVVMTKDHDYLQLINDEHSVGARMVQSKREESDGSHGRYYAPYGLDKRSINLPEETFGFTVEHIFMKEGV